MTTSDPTFEEVLGLAKQLTPVQKLRLVEAIVPDLAEPLNQAHEEQRPLRSLYGLWKDLNLDISAEDIDEAWREMWGLFPREAWMTPKWTQFGSQNQIESIWTVELRSSMSKGNPIWLPF